jgi:hypothetical protein
LPTYFRALASVVLVFASLPPHVAATAPINKATKLAREKTATALWAASEVSCGRSVNVGIGANIAPRAAAAVPVAIAAPVITTTVVTVHDKNP